MPAQTWNEQGYHQWTSFSRQGKSHEALTIHHKDRQLRKTKDRRSGLPQGWKHQTVIQFQMVNVENMHIKNVTWLSKIVFKNHICRQWTWMGVGRTIEENLKEDQKREQFWQYYNYNKSNQNTFMVNCFQHCKVNLK